MFYLNLLLAAIGLVVNRKQPWAIALIVVYNVALSQCYDLDLVAAMRFNEAFKPEFTRATYRLTLLALTIINTLWVLWPKIKGWVLILDMAVFLLTAVPTMGLKGCYGVCCIFLGLIEAITGLDYQRTGMLVNVYGQPLACAVTALALMHKHWLSVANAVINVVLCALIFAHYLPYSLPAAGRLNVEEVNGFGDAVGISSKAANILIFAGFFLVSIMVSVVIHYLTRPTVASHTTTPPFHTTEQQPER